ncbi:serine protease inhibitor 14 precursor [Bombyx mori]|uniref:Serpin-14 n=1 Tax=Bombyx mori TaxID=7091 RepID=C0J8G3_BOMMO|nr:serine protease inhibitor 14 precursor [Bombyx mori]ACG61177.1 serpin-14 [Bombyx mori]
MALKLLILLAFCQAITALKYPCTNHKTIALLKRPTYDFSIGILQRVAEETNDNFVFSPLSNWLQLIALSEGAKGRTLKELWRVTRFHMRNCFKRELGKIMRNIETDLKFETKETNVIVIDKLMNVKRKFLRNIKQLYGVKAALLDFNSPEKSAIKANKMIEQATNGKISEAFYYDDFLSTVLLMSDAKYFDSFWKSPFNAAYTRMEPFYSKNGLKIGEVAMMNQIGYFNITYFPLIKADVLELPLSAGQYSMLIFLPEKNTWVKEIFYSLEATRLTSLFNVYKNEGLKLVNVKLPKFKISTEIENLPELLVDMGIERIFSPDSAEFGGISDYKIYASLMTQICEISVTEKGVKAHGTAEFIISGNETLMFNANRPFAYMIVERKTEFILFSGTYAVPYS